MSQQYSQPPPRTYSPLPRTDSPHHGPPNPFPPPIKRQPLSPNPQSPYGSPGVSPISLPNQVFSSPYYGSHANGASANHSYNPYQQPSSAASPPSNQNQTYGNQANNSYTPNAHYNPYATHNPPNTNHNYNTMPAPPPQTPSGAMGPPSRPATDKPTDINELGDVIAGTGIDLREEELALSNAYSRAQQRQDSGYGANSAVSNHAAPRDNYYMQNVPGDRNSFYGAGTFNQYPGPPKSAEEIAAEARKKALRTKSEIQSYHLNDPFLYPKSLATLIKKQARNMQVVIPTVGHYNSQARPDAPPRQLIVQGPDKNEVLKMVTSEDFLDVGTAYGEILALLSLATQERIRGIVEDAAALAKGRRTGSHGVVPLELADLAKDSGATEAVAGLPPSNSTVSPTSNPLKRSYAEMNKPLAPNSPSDQKSTTTKAFTNPVAQALNKIAQAQRQAEEERLAKRQRRLAVDGDRAGSGSLGTPGTPGEIAPEVDTKKGSKAKNEKDAAAKKANEAQQHAATMQTMNIALGLSGKMGKKLSWMNKGADPGPSNPFLPKPNLNASSSKAGAPGTNGAGSNVPKKRVFGDFREDRDTGAKIQLRDVISVLEHDGKERKTLQRAYYKQGEASSRR